MGDFEATITKTVFLRKFEIWNEIYEKVVRILSENCINRLVEVKNLKVYWRVIREQIWTQNFILLDVCIVFWKIFRCT